jgi:hypothetical protein
MDIPRTAKSTTLMILRTKEKTHNRNPEPRPSYHISYTFMCYLNQSHAETAKTPLQSFYYTFPIRSSLFSIYKCVLF